MTNYAQLNIGRNYPAGHAMAGQPMSDGLWAEARANATEWLTSCITDPMTGMLHGPNDPTLALIRKDVQVHTGMGEWDGEPEESVHVSLYHDHGIDTDAVRVVAKMVAHKYEQAAVAVTFGSQLIEG